jgi:hypothetical protein
MELYAKLFPRLLFLYTAASIASSPMASCRDLSRPEQVAYPSARFSAFRW